MEHEVRAIIGPNGAGKSSMLNVINGVYHPQEGEIIFRGEHRRDMNTHQAAEQGIARTFQNIALFKGMSVLDNIMTGRNLRMKCNLLLQALWMGPGPARGTGAPQEGRGDHRLPRNPAYPQDPGRAPALRPAKARRPRRAPWPWSRRVLLLDEPMAGMNVEEKQDMCRFILDVNDQFGTTIVLIEHDMGVVMDISDRVVVLDYGKKIGDGVPDEVRANPEVISAYLGASH
jgi:branched-chain amino acid transport system ATP-binding protein